MGTHPVGRAERSLAAGRVGLGTAVASPWLILYWLPLEAGPRAMAGTKLTRDLERRLKRGVFGLLARRPPGRTIAPADVDLAGCRRVLLIRTNFRMGNLLLVTPALTGVRRALPQARIDVLCAHRYADLLAHNDDVDRVLTLERRIIRQPRELTRLIATLRRERYDLVVDAARGGSFLGAFFAAASGGRYRAAAAGSRYRRLFNVHVPRRRGSLHKVDLLLAFLDGLGVPPISHDLKLVLTPTEKERAETRWCALGLAPSAPAAGVFIGGRGDKRWPMARLRRLLERLHDDLHLAVVLFAGPEDEAQLERLGHDLR